jgi:hypothetical protein
MPYALCPMPYALCQIVPHVTEKGYNTTQRATLRAILALVGLMMKCTALSELRIMKMSEQQI